MVLILKKSLLTLMCGALMGGITFSPAAGLDNLNNGCEYEISEAPGYFHDCKGLETNLLEFSHPLKNGDPTIGYSLATPQKVAICIFDHQGDEVLQLVEKIQTIGFHHVVWNGCHDDGKKALAGTYFLMMKTDESVFLRRLVLE